MLSDDGQAGNDWERVLFQCHLWLLTIFCETELSLNGGKCDGGETDGFRPEMMALKRVEASHCDKLVLEGGR